MRKMIAKMHSQFKLILSELVISNQARSVSTAKFESSEKSICSITIISVA